MSKIKMRCSQCGKSFKSTNPKQLICPECEERARRERAAKTRGTLAGSSAPPPQPRYIPPARPARPAQAASEPKRHWLDQQTDIKIVAAAPPQPARPPRLDIPEPRPSPPPSAASAASSGGTPRAQTATGQLRQPGQTRHAGAGAPASAPDHKARRPDQQKKGDGARPKGSRPASAKPKREPRQPTQPFTPTPEQVAAIEQRYLEMAQTGEFDGIRTQIARELSLPKATVKKVVYALRQRQDIPSWWDLQPYHGSPEDLERIRSVYVPLLPRPPIGVHKQIAAQLNLPAGTVYQAIKVLRAELNLPQYNPPEEHQPSLEAP